MSAPTGALAVLGRRRRVIEDGGNRTPQTPPAAAWVTGALAAVQAAVLSLAILVLPSVVAYVATSADPSNVGTSWFSSVRVASALWLLGHGTPATAGGASVSLIPLGLSILLVFALYASARRTARAAWPALWAGMGTYTLCCLVVALVAGSVGAGQLFLTVVGAVVVSGVGLGLGILADPDAPRLRMIFAPVLDRVPGFVVLSMRAGVLVCALLAFVSAAFVIVWIVLGRAASIDVINALSLGTLDAIVLALAQALFVANIVIWAGAWLAGPGFVVGTGSQFAPTGVVLGPLPAVPVLGALPDQQLVSPVSAFAPLLIVLLGVVAGVYVRRRTGPLSWRMVATSLAAIVLTVGVLVSVLVVLGSGGIGPGRMTEVGADAVIVAGAIMAEVLLGASIVLAALHPSAVAAVRSALNWRTWRRWLHRATGSTAPAPGVPGAGVPTASATSAGTGVSSATAQTAGSVRTAGSVHTARTVQTVGTVRTVQTPHSARSAD